MLQISPNREKCYNRLHQSTASSSVDLLSEKLHPAIPHSFLVMSTTQPTPSGSHLQSLSDQLFICSSSFENRTTTVSPFRPSKLLRSVPSEASNNNLQDPNNIGAATTCYVALHPNLRGVTGKYFDEELSRRL
ncbi:short-chain dehydrogenase TIC 32, chloroplastic-like [Zingiber officinale]|uniref:short-chain dehydrogenase TIC 32, chloroplastic-like n=1 Tax=Zingiber officinale TaxID=94328 RepID=UPI001C4C6106|nr:short-chain dehydrogenase TIC 32, chloroplastic-like [Zingiber officinale]